MLRKTIGLTVAAFVVAVAAAPLASRATLGEEKKREFCTQTADLALSACQADVAEEFYRGRAICLNVLDLAERRECIAERNAARAEMREECEAIHGARLDACGLLGEGRYDPDFAPEHFTHPDEIVTHNPYGSLAAGHTFVIVAEEDEEVVVVHVTDRVIEIAGVPCRIVIDAVFSVDNGTDKGAAVEYEIVEITDDWFAHHTVTGDLWYCGERVRNFEDGILVDQDGSFEAGVDGAEAGILIPSAPFVGQAYRQEWALDEAEDLAEVVSLAASPGDDKGGSPFACNGECLKTHDTTALEPGGGEFKYYLPGVGFVLAESIEDGEVEGISELVTCIGDSLEVLQDPACGIDDAEALLEALCRNDPDTFCAD